MGRRIKLLLGSITALCSLQTLSAFADCNCGSSDTDNPCTSRSIDLSLSSSGRTIEFNWNFYSGDDESPAFCGQFANGDYWIAPREGETLTLSSLSSVGSGAVYLDENPTPEALGFLHKNYGNLYPEENILPQLPRHFTSSVSLVAAVQRDEDEHGGCGTKSILGACVEAYQVVTVLPSVPENAGQDLLRPSVTTQDKELLSMDDFVLSRLPQKSYFEGADASELESIRKVWSHHLEVFSMRDKDGNGYSEGGRAFRADFVTDDYAASVARHWHADLARLMSDDNSMSQKRAALAAMLTYGKDIYYHTYDSAGRRIRWFGTGAGQSIGRFPAAAFFASMASDSHYSDVLSRASSTQVNIGGESVQEFDQLNIGPNGPVWGDHDTFDNQYDIGRYWEEMLLAQRFDGATGNYVSKISGKKTFRDPHRYIDGPGASPGSAYASVTAGPIKAFAAEMLLMPTMCQTVNYDAVVEYAIRITDVGLQSANDPCAPPDPREDPGECNTYHLTGCRYYGLHYDVEPTWGPDPDDWSQCIQNGTDPLTGEPQTGRFSDYHGTDFNIGYPVWAFEQNWETIVDGRLSCRSLNRPKPPSNLQVTE